MVKQVNFKTNGTATSGIGVEELSEQAFVQFGHGVAIVDIFQTSCGTVANDADWNLYIDGVQTRYKWTAEELNPANIGRVKLPSPITIKPNTMIQMKWAGQAAAASNILKILYEVC